MQSAGWDRASRPLQREATRPLRCRPADASTRVRESPATYAAVVTQFVTHPRPSGLVLNFSCDHVTLPPATPAWSHHAGSSTCLADLGSQGWPRRAGRVGAVPPPESGAQSNIDSVLIRENRPHQNTEEETLGAYWAWCDDSRRHRMSALSEMAPYHSSAIRGRASLSAQRRFLPGNESASLGSL